MKKILTTIIVLLTSAQLFATIRTVSNNSNVLGQYPNLASAIGSSLNGDTVYISGSPVKHSAIAINKSVTIIGTGFNPQKQNPIVSTISFLSISTGVVKLYGIEIDTLRFLSAMGECEVHNCLLNNGYFDYDNEIKIFGSIIKNSLVFSSNAFDCDIYNSIIYPQIQLANASNAILDVYNSIFLFNGKFISATGVYKSSNDYKNCIFYGAIPEIDGGTPNLIGQGDFRYNLSFPNTFPDDDGNNIVANPLFVNVPSPPVLFNLTQNFHLQSGSPALLNTDINGNQRGIYSTFWAEYIYRDNGIPPIPSIQTMNITPATVNSGQTITINFSSKTNQ
ncbi:MAG: hypothetical protein RIQ89_257 [Bacteroidota bacterium]|jgi:hypothetical protein